MCLAYVGKKSIYGECNAYSYCNNVAKADVLEDAIEAHYKGNHAQALELLHPLAEEGNVIAQGLLGRMYLRGEGVLQDYPKQVGQTNTSQPKIFTRTYAHDR